MVTAESAGSVTAAGLSGSDTGATCVVDPQAYALRSRPTPTQHRKFLIWHPFRVIRPVIAIRLTVDDG